MSSPINIANQSMTYQSAGVDIDQGNQVVERIKPMVAKTRRAEVITGLGGFGGLFALGQRYQDPVLVSGTDGVGTKLKLAIQLQHHDSIGIDLVAMCVNDILAHGAEPLFFLDYYATGRLDADLAVRVIASICRGCEQAGCALIGGETAEMPGMYNTQDYDLAGFCVGAAERSALINIENVHPNDCIIGIASSGPHANGYSLIRKVITETNADLNLLLTPEKTLANALLEPTTIYVKPILSLLKKISVCGLAHITGGGLQENIIRAVPNNLSITINPEAWPQPAIFQWLQNAGQISSQEMWRTFNCGIGYAIIVRSHDVQATQQHLASMFLDNWVIGHVHETNSIHRVTILNKQ